jgi:glycerol uptake facilitator-like aquaporin
MNDRFRVLAEGVGTSLLLAIVIGSGIMAVQLAQGNAAIALLANTAATVAGLIVLIEIIGPLSGAHFNPVVSLLKYLDGELTLRLLVAYVVAQLVGATVGAWIAHAMFELPVIQVSSRLRSGAGQWFAEALATAGLVSVIYLAPPGRVSWLVALWIGAAYWFTASTSFANPAAVMGRMWSDSFAGIAPSSGLGFVLAQMVGGITAWLAVKALLKAKT